MIKLLTQAYSFYSSVDKSLRRRAVRKLLAKRRSYDQALEIERVLTPEGEVLISVPFICGRHDFQDFHRWTPQGLRQLFEKHGLKVQNSIGRGATALAINRLFVNFIHDRNSANSIGYGLIGTKHGAKVEA